jgi:hypothetical protein
MSVQGEATRGAAGPGQARQDMAWRGRPLRRPLFLTCGHAAAFAEVLRQGSERWCNACARWEPVASLTHTDPRGLDDWRTALRYEDRLRPHETPVDVEERAYALTDGWVR